MIALLILGFKFAFRSTATDGLILLAATPASQSEYLAVYLENGGLTFAFNTQGQSRNIK